MRWQCLARAGRPRGLRELLREPLRAWWHTLNAQTQGTLLGYLYLQMVTGCVSPTWLPSQSTTDVAAWKTNSPPPSSGGCKSKIKGSAGLESLPAAEGRLLPVSPRDLSNVGALRHLLFPRGTSSDWASSALPNGLIYLSHFFKGPDAVTFWGTGVRGLRRILGDTSPSKRHREQEQLQKAPGPLHRWRRPCKESR